MTICIGTKIAIPGITAAGSAWELSEGEIPGNDSELLSEKTKLKSQSVSQPDSQGP